MIKSVLAIARAEASLFSRFPKLRLSVAGIVLIPALYALIYLSAVWDPASRTGALPALIVNLDQGLDVRGQRVNLGQDLARKLEGGHAFGFRSLADEDEARRDVRAGRSLFALIIPRDFSANAVPGDAAGRGKLVVFASEGNNYTGAGFARRFAAELGHQVNETLNEKRWSLVLGTAADAGHSLQQLRDGVGRLRSGAQALDAGLARAEGAASAVAGGSTQLSGGVLQLTDGVKQLGAGIRQMDAKKPAPADLQALKGGAAQLAAGHADLGRGLAELEGGAGKLAEGALKLRDETKGIPLVGGKVSAGAGQLADGAKQLGTGLHAARDGQGKLADGAQSLSQGVAALTDGMAALGLGIGTLAAKLPPDATLDALATGSRQLADGSGQLQGGLGQLHAGAQQLAGGLDLLAASLPASAPAVGGTAPGLAVSVLPEVQVDAPVPNNGTGFAPNFLPVALWLGAVMTTFLFHLRRLPLAVQGHGRVQLLAGKLLILGGIVLAQSLSVYGMATALLGIRAEHPVGLLLTLMVTSLTFLLIILTLVRAFGDAGKAVGLILLILQLSSAGGVVPIELTSGFFRAISPWLPFTWVVRAVRASMFGAYDSDWLAALGVVALAGLIAFALATFVGRWRFVADDEHRPAMDI